MASPGWPVGRRAPSPLLGKGNEPEHSGPGASAASSDGNDNSHHQVKQDTLTWPISGDLNQKQQPFFFFHYCKDKFLEGVRHRVAKDASYI